MDTYSIYPKQFRNAKIPIEKNRCFVLMPFSENFNIIYGNIKKSLHENEYICNRADEILGSKPIMNKILNEILKANYIIADLTSQNPNVFYELGIAHTFKDAQNIILITQRLEDIPFDIRHINNIIYEPNNLKYLTSSIIQTLGENKYVLDFHEALQQKNIIGTIHDNKEEFVNYLQNSLTDLVFIATDIISGNLIDFNEYDVERYFNRLISIILETIKESNYNFLTGIMKVLHESVIVCSKFTITDRITYDLLYGNLLETYKIDVSEAISYQTDLAITLASHGVKTNTVMAWIINYFSHSKSATIDLNRYKVERFLMITSDEVINNTIIDAIFNENPYIREHMADICGEKKLLEASYSIISQLRVEENFFTAVSLISAIGKLEPVMGADAIMKWDEENFDAILKTNQLFVLKHSYIAISRLDKKFNSENLATFNNKYGTYIKDYFIL